MSNFIISIIQNIDSSLRRDAMCNNVRERLQCTLNNGPDSGLVILILIL